ncbi:Intraflagellar transport protein 57 -like protein [Halotydeus destructor]|nr:Intraflagellar transport protein 57 -like protein [Halotydeus destructor]
MPSQSDSKGDEDVDDKQSPGYHYVSNFEAMNGLHDKLSLMQYTRAFCSEYKCKPLHRYYFSLQSNPGEQFYTFSCLSAWLIKNKCKLPIQGSLNPQEYEDPNLTIAAILEGLALALGHLELSSLPIDFASAKLKPGFGSEVLQVLSILADCALRVSPPHQGTNGVPITVNGLQDVYHEDEDPEMASNEDNELEINFEEQYTLIDEHVTEHDGHLDLLMTTALGLNSSSDLGHVALAGPEKPKDILRSSTDQLAWKAEVDRVLPRLKVVLRTSDQHKADWRSHVTDMHRTKKDIDEQFSSTQTSLAKVSTEVSRSLDKISSKEKYLQLQFESLVNEYAALKGQLATVEDKYRTVSVGVTDKSRILSQLNEELDLVKNEMEERSSNMTDGTPLISLRKNLQKMKAELTSIDIRIGVASHTILQANLHDTSLQSQLERGASLELDSPIKLTQSSLHRLVF